MMPFPAVLSPSSLQSVLSINRCLVQKVHSSLFVLLMPELPRKSSFPDQYYFLGNLSLN